MPTGRIPIEHIAVDIVLPAFFFLSFNVGVWVRQSKPFPCPGVTAGF